MEYLDFEKPIEDLIEKLNQTILLGEEGEVDVSSTVTEIEKKINEQERLFSLRLAPNFNF